MELVEPCEAYTPFSRPNSSSSNGSSNTSSSNNDDSSSSSSNAPTSNSSSSSSSSSGKDSIWIEKYRPQTLDDVVGNDEVLQRLRIIALEGNMPHLLLAGPPGTGKTSSVLCLARQLLQAKWRSSCLELNASDER
ncbi:Replication factor C (Activator 1) 2, related [Eimeria brunetti]|uniref:Replication factor C (Activator 1) 2, related n=1 Tax=Eimeria brunetti TaxID=51314 RepID=U6LGA3_9EIME|nr:Replication factor C (Activator 1) 2, related [Eimeria brunetti]